MIRVLTREVYDRLVTVLADELFYSRNGERYSGVERGAELMLMGLHIPQAQAKALVRDAEEACSKREEAQANVRAKGE